MKSKLPGFQTLAAGVQGTSDVPFARKATQALAASLARIAHAIDEDRIDTILESRPGAVQVAANLCDALLKMQPEREHSALAFSVSWAASHPIPTVGGPVVLRNEHFPLINVMSQRLRGEVAPQAAEFIGHVDELRGVLGEDGRRQGEIRLTLYHEDEAVKASVSLTAARLSVLNGVVGFDLLPQGQQLASG